MIKNKTYVYADFEFTKLASPNGKNFLLSIALVTDDKNIYFYAEKDLSSFAMNNLDEWIKKNVVDNFIINKDSLNPNHHIFENKHQLKEMLKEWFEKSFKNNKEIVIVLDVGQFDWVYFCDIFDSAFNIPKNIFYAPIDISTLFFLNKNISSEVYSNGDVDRLKFIEKYSKDKQILENINKQHNSLFDAYVCKECFYLLSK